MISDIRYAARQLTKYPGYTAVAAATLALGIGANTMMFSVLNAIVLQSSPAPESSRLVGIVGTSARSNERSLSPGDFYDLQRQSTAFEQVGAYNWANFNLVEDGKPAERISGMSVTGNFFQVFGIPPELGRTIGPRDDEPGSEKAAVLSDAYWRGHFSADPGVIGRTVRMDTRQVTIVGVMPPSFENLTYWGHVDAWEAMALDGPSRQIRDNSWLRGIGRLKRGATLGQASAEASAIAGRLARDFPQNDLGNGLRLVSWNSVRTGEVSGQVLWLCMGLAGFVLLIACANLANLQLARMTSRVRENAVRIALGASRLQLIRQLLVESLLLSAMGGAIGVLIAAWGTRVFSRGIYITGIQGIDIPIDTSVLIFTVVATAATGVAIGLIPAWSASRTDVNSALKQGSRGSAGDQSRHLIRRILIISELALALLLLNGAGFFVRGSQRLAAADGGWRPDGLLTASMSLPFNANYQSDAQCRAFFDKLSARMSELPGVEQSSISVSLPITGFWRTSGIVVQGRPAPEHGKEPLAYYNSESPGNISNLGQRILRGRAFTDADRADSRPVAIINEAMARALFPGENPVGRQIADAGAKSPVWTEIVGVVSDLHPSLELVRAPDTAFQVHLPLAQTPNQYTHWFNMAIRSTAPAPTVAAALRAAVQQIDADQPVYGIVTAREGIFQLVGSFGLTAKMLGAFALVGLALSAVGIFGVIANLVAQRTPEIGIRMALGAQTGDVLWLVLGQGVRLAAAGTAIGLALGWGLVRLLDSVLPMMHGSDPVTVGAVSCFLAAVALFACWLPARRATRIDPIIALRSE